MPTLSIRRIVMFPAESRKRSPIHLDFAMTYAKDWGIAKGFLTPLYLEPANERRHHKGIHRPRKNAMTTNPVALKASRAKLKRLPFLAGAALKFNLEDELRELRSRESWQRNSGRSSKTLAKYPDLHIVLILMKSNTRMNEHHVDGRTSIQLLRGKLRVHLPRESVEIHAGHLLALEYGILHHVEALEESAFVITISWPGGTKEERHARYSVS